MAKGGGELIHHVNGVRMRLTGAGNLQMTLHTLNSSRTQNLVPLVMQATTDREPFRLANFKSQRIALEVFTDQINERFLISKIVIFDKVVETDYPA